MLFFQFEGLFGWFLPTILGEDECFRAAKSQHENGSCGFRNIPLVFFFFFSGGSKINQAETKVCGRFKTTSQDFLCGDQRLRPFRRVKFFFFWALFVGFGYRVLGALLEKYAWKA